MRPAIIRRCAVIDDCNQDSVRPFSYISTVQRATFMMGSRFSVEPKPYTKSVRPLKRCVLTTRFEEQLPFMVDHWTSTPSGFSSSEGSDLTPGKQVVPAGQSSGTA